MTRPWLFDATCPLGHPATQDRLDKAALRSLLKRGEPIRLRCAHCGSEWDADAAKRDLIGYLLANT